MLTEVGSIAFLLWDPRRAGDQPRPAAELLFSTLSPTLSHPKLVVTSLINMNNKPVRRFHSSHFMPQRASREPEHLPQGCTVGTLPRPA